MSFFASLTAKNLAAQSYLSKDESTPTPNESVPRISKTSLRLITSFPEEDGETTPTSPTSARVSIPMKPRQSSVVRSKEFTRNGRRRSTTRRERKNPEMFMTCESTCTVNSDEGTTLGYPTTMKRLTIQAVDEAYVIERYSIGAQVMPSTHRGTEIRFGQRLRDGLNVVVKTRAKDKSFRTEGDRELWRMTTEWHLNLQDVDGICHFHEVLETPTQFYVIMEKVEGKDLFEQLQCQKPTSAETRVIMHQLLKALFALHSRGRVHRDIKLENVMIDMDSPKGKGRMAASRFSSRDSVGSSASTMASWSGSGVDRVLDSPIETKLIDFDTVVDASPVGSPTISRTVVGTDGYIAPEAYLGKYSTASDIFSAGVIMYKLLTRKYPWSKNFFDDVPGENWVGSIAMNRIAEKLMNTEINYMLEPLDEDDMARDLVQRMLSPKPEDRPSCREVLQHGWFNVDEL